MKSVTLLLFYFLSQTAFSQNICGIVIDTETKKPLLNALVYLLKPDKSEDTTGIYYWRIYKYKIVRQTKTDSTGKYSFSAITPGTYNLVAEFPLPESKIGGYGSRDEIDSNIVVNEKTGYFKTFNLLVTCPYDKTRNQSFCPKCKKTDKVVPIIFGLPVYDKDGNIDGKSEGQYHLGGCFIDLYCDPSKHCKRCKIDF